MAPNPKIQSKKHIARLERERRQTRLIQYIAIGVVAAVVLILAYGYLDLNFLQMRQPVVEVNGEEISTQAFQSRVSLQRQQLIEQYFQILQYQQVVGADLSSQLQQIQFSLDTPISIGQQTLDAMIEEVLIRQEAQRRGIQVSAEELEQYTQAQFLYFPDGTPTPTITPTEPVIAYPTLSRKQLQLITPTPVSTEIPTSTPQPSPTVDPSVGSATPSPTFPATPTSTPYTLAGYQDLYATAVANLEESGFTETDFNQFLEVELLRRKLFDLITADIPLVEEQVWARHILVPDEETAETVLERLAEGEDFAVVARAVSEDPGSSDSGGDLGWFGRGQMVPEFEEAAFSLEIGETSSPINSPFGWHIIQVIDRTELPLTAAGYEQARQQQFSEFLASLREDAEITEFEYWTDRIPTTPSLEEFFGQ